MCGILGILSIGSSAGLKDVDMSALKNRGPDGDGIYRDGGLGLYHTRLAVIDKNITSNQPITSICGNYTVVCNGEIYNYEKLKKTYPYNYQTTSDCETILACYRQEGINGFKKLKGTFSFALYDKVRKKFLIHRDAVGKKPLFYYADKDSFLVSSSVTAIRDNLGVELNINKEALYSYLREGFVRPDLSFYDGIKPVLPGRLIEIDTITGEISNYKVTPESINYDSFDFSPGELIREAERLLEQGVEERLARIEKPVLLFSGGIDSTVLAKMMKKSAGTKTTCIGLKSLIPFTYDEPYAMYAAGRLNLKYIPVSISMKELTRNVEKAVSLLDQPLSVYSYYLLTYLTRSAKEFGNVLFLGDGGDEVFYGYSDIRAWFSESVNADQKDHFDVGPESKQMLSLWGRRQISANLLGHSFVKVDKATAEQQMEARCPYLDWDLMNFMRNIPERCLIRSGETKAILKSLLSDFPSWFIKRRKIGMEFNFRYLMAPFYRYLYNEIDFNMLFDIGLEENKFRFSHKDFFVNFDKYWKLYILSRFMLIS
jgi:asparagine synthase (glutamine-hydrolysing)